MKSRGLGDSIYKFTKATGIKSAVDKVSQGLNIPCGCEGRRNALNNFNKILIFPSKPYLFPRLIWIGSIRFWIFNNIKFFFYPRKPIRVIYFIFKLFINSS